MFINKSSLNPILLLYIFFVLKKSLNCEFSFYKHFCFSKLLSLRGKKGSRVFFRPLEYQKNEKFQRILQKHHAGDLHKKCTILHQAPQITLFFTHPV